MQKQRPAYNHLPRLGKSTPGTQKAIGRQPRKTRTRSTKSIGIKTKTKLRFTIFLLLLTQIRFRPRFLRNIMADIKEVIQLLGLMSLRLSKKIKTRSKT